MLGGAAFHDWTGPSRLPAPCNSLLLVPHSLLLVPHSLLLGTSFVAAWYLIRCCRYLHRIFSSPAGSPGPAARPAVLFPPAAATTEPAKMVRISVLNDCLNSICNAEKRGKRQVMVRPASKVTVKFLSVMMKHGEKQRGQSLFVASAPGILVFESGALHLATPTRFPAFVFLDRGSKHSDAAPSCAGSLSGIPTCAATIARKAGYCGLMTSLASYTSYHRSTVLQTPPRPDYLSHNQSPLIPSHARNPSSLSFSTPSPSPATCCLCVCTHTSTHQATLMSLRLSTTTVPARLSCSSTAA